MEKHDEIIALFRAKGWNLYRDHSSGGLPEIVGRGKADSLEPGVSYHVLPATSHSNMINELTEHLLYAQKSNQLPTYNDRVNPPTAIRGVIVTDGGFSIIPVVGGAEDGILHGYEFDASSASHAIRHYVSNYNVYYFTSLDEVTDFVTRNRILPQRPSPLPGQLRWSYAAHDADPSWRSIYPANASQVLFRGQVARFEPCQSTITRGLKASPRELSALSTEDCAELILRLVKTQWFVEILKTTPACRWMGGQRILLNKNALAQHYGLPTGYIDLSQSFDVAAFFSCCSFDCGESTWNPVSSGEGVVYVLDQRLVPLGAGAIPICLQPFPRPSEQWGWVHELTLGDDFDCLPYVKKFIFRHDREVSQRWLDQFSRGADLFPPDPLAKVADGILKARTVPLAVALEVICDLIGDPLGLPDAEPQDVVATIKNLTGIAPVDDAEAILTEEITAEMEDVWSRRRSTFLRGIGFRLTRTLREDDM